MRLGITTAPPILKMSPAEGAENFYGNVQSNICAGWSLDEPFVLSGQFWLSQLIRADSPHSDVCDFMLNFHAAFEVSTFKHTLGRAQKKIPECEESRPLANWTARLRGLQGGLREL